MNPDVVASFQILADPPKDGRPIFLASDMAAEAASYVEYANTTFTEANASPEEDIPAVLLLGGPGGIIAVPVGPALVNAFTKSALTKSIQNATSMFDFIHSIALITPSYVTKVPPEIGRKFVKDGLPPEGVEGYERTEVVTIVLELRDGLGQLGTSDVTRFDDKPPHYADVSWVTPEQTSGRLAGFFTHSSSATEH